MEYNDNTILKISYETLSELLYAIQADAINADGCDCALEHKNLDAFIKNEIEVKKTISVIE